MKSQRYNPVTGKVETYALPEKGDQGLNGKDGINGQRGNKWFSGKGPPNNIVDSLLGDKYLDTDTGDIYEFE